MLELATKHGYVCQPIAEMTAELAHEIASRMKPQLGNNVYQMLSFSLPSFSPVALDKILL